MNKVCYWHHNWLVIKLNNKNVRNKLADIRGVVYDLGCGIRPYEKDILAVADRYIGVDWSNTIHELKSDIIADLNQPLPIGDKVADTVVSFQVLEHLCEPQIMLNEAFRILKPSGTIILTVPFQWWVHEAPHDYFRYTRHGLEYLLGKVCFVDVIVKESSGFWSMWVLKLNYQLARLVRGPKLVRWFIRLCLLPLWISSQLIAPMIDRYWHAPQETAVYIATAKKR